MFADITWKKFFVGLAITVSFFVLGHVVSLAEANQLFSEEVTSHWLNAMGSVSLLWLVPVFLCLLIGTSRRVMNRSVIGYMRAKAWLFDMDGVLVDNCDYHVIAWLEFAKRHGGHLTKKQVLDWMGAPGRDYIRRMFDREVPDDEMRTLLEEKERLYREIYAPHMVTPAGLVDLLERGRAKGIKFAIATGGSMTNVNFVLDGTGLRKYFPCVVDSSQYEHGKPAPDCYLRAADKVGAAPEDCVVFEDAVNGIESAKSAGMRVVAIVGTNTKETLESAAPTTVINTFKVL